MKDKSKVLKTYGYMFAKLQFVSLIGGTRPNLGATRPRVGICKSRLDALTCKYMNIHTSSIANLGHRTPSWQCRRVPEAAEKSHDVGRRYRCNICVSH